MKKLLSLVLMVFAAHFSLAQHTEIWGGANAGVFTFTGPSTQKVSYISNSTRPTFRNYTSNPYGSDLGSAFGVSVQAQRVTRNRLLFGLNTGYEKLSSRTEITGIYTDTASFIIAATGKTNINYHFINLHPFVGYRFHLACLEVDLTGGLDIAKALKAQENGQATDHTGNSVTTSLARPLKSLDMRTRLQLNAFYQKTGLSISYSEGFTNYKEGWVGGPNLVFSRVFRLGLVYKFR